MKKVLKMAKNVQIPQELFVLLCQYHLCDIANVEDKICNELSIKLDSLVNRELYSKYKDKTLSAEERELARKEYLDRKGVPDNFRW